MLFLPATRSPNLADPSLTPDASNGTRYQRPFADVLLPGHPLSPSLAGYSHWRVSDARTMVVPFDLAPALVTVPPGNGHCRNTVRILFAATTHHARCIGRSSLAHSPSRPTTTSAYPRSDLDTKRLTDALGNGLSTIWDSVSSLTREPRYLRHLTESLH